MRVWTHADVKADLSLYDKMLDCMRLIAGRDETFRKELAKLDGIQMRIQLTIKRGPSSIRYVEEVVELAEKDPPAGAYEVPEGYTRVDRLSGEDF